MLIFHSLWTVVLVVVFLGIVIWAFNSKRRQAFDEAAHLPLLDDPAITPDEEQNRG
jgi:cytochrome c oxidase cbb3-type subunit IV